MRISKLLKIVEPLKERNALSLEISDILKDFNEGKKLNDEEKTLLGLAYSEFISRDDSMNELAVAEEKRQVLLKELGLNGSELVKKVEQYLK